MSNEWQAPNVDTSSVDLLVYWIDRYARDDYPWGYAAQQLEKQAKIVRQRVFRRVAEIEEE